MPPPRYLFPFLYAVVYRLNFRQGTGELRAQMSGVGCVTFLLSIVVVVALALIGKILAIDLLGILYLPLILVAIAIGIVADRILVKRGVGIRFEKRFDRIGAADRAWLFCYAALLLVLVVGGVAVSAPAAPPSAVTVLVPPPSAN